MKMYEGHEMCGEADSGTLYKIGMFAAMNRVTVKALRFYEEQGLLLPAYIDAENGYRYYKLCASIMAKMKKHYCKKRNQNFFLKSLNLRNRWLF